LKFAEIRAKYPLQPQRLATATPMSSGDVIDDRDIRYVGAELMSACRKLGRWIVSERWYFAVFSWFMVKLQSPTGHDVYCFSADQVQFNFQ